MKTNGPIATFIISALLYGALVALTSVAFTPSIAPRKSTSRLFTRTVHFIEYQASVLLSRSRPPQPTLRLYNFPLSQPTELPDSLDDAASTAANACQQLSLSAGPMIRCRVDIDTSAGDETYTALKSTTEFMQKFVSSLCLACIPGILERMQQDVMRLMKAKSDLNELQQEMEMKGTTFNISEESTGDSISIDNDNTTTLIEREEELITVIKNQGADPSSPWVGPKVRIYFPDEGSAALARRDWKNEVPVCVEFSACGGVQVADISNDSIVIFFCPRASEAEFVESILYKSEDVRGQDLIMTVMVNPILVDMGVTGFGMAGRRLRERLIDGLVPVYYLRTLTWGALTRSWPQLFSIWQEDADADGGYKLIKSMDRLPSNPEVEDIFSIANGDMKDPEEGFGFLNAIAEFVNGMTKL